MQLLTKSIVFSFSKSLSSTKQQQLSSFHKTMGFFRTALTWFLLGGIFCAGVVVHSIHLKLLLYTFVFLFTYVKFVKL